MTTRQDRIIVLHGKAVVSPDKDSPISILVDTGCTTSCMPEKTARKLGLTIRRRRRPLVAVLADGSRKPITHHAILTFRLSQHITYKLQIHMTGGTLEPHDMLLGMDWLTQVNPKVGFKPLSLKITDKSGADVEIMGKRPTGAEHCPVHGYACGREDKNVGPSIFRTGIDEIKDKFRNILPRDSPIPVFRAYETDDKYEPCCVRGPTGDRQQKWFDWRLLTNSSRLEVAPEVAETNKDKVRRAVESSDNKPATSSRSRSAPRVYAKKSSSNATNGNRARKKV